MAFDDLRSFLSHLESLPGEVEHIRDPLNPQWEIAAVMGHIRGAGPVVVAEEVQGYPGWRVAGNVIGTNRRIAVALEVPEQEVDPVYLERRKRFLAPVKAETAPVKEVTITKDIDLTKTLPILTFHEGDVGPYITSGICMAHDKDSGCYHLGIHRIQVMGPDRLGILLASPPLSVHHAAVEARGEVMEIAVVIGVDPLFELVAVERTICGPDKICMAGGLRGRPLSMVPAETLSFMVPAMAEVVIEGLVRPGVRQPEGPFGETTGYYFSFETPVIEVTAITHRANPIYRTMFPSGPEVETIMELLGRADTRHYLTQLVEDFRGFTFVPGTHCFNGVLAVKKKNQAHARRAALVALAVDARLKQVTVVDDDVDINSQEDVAWAVATRCKADEDIIVMPGMLSYVIDPAAKDGGTAKVIIDATKPSGEETQFGRCRPTSAAISKAESIWAKLGCRADKY